MACGSKTSLRSVGRQHFVKKKKHNTTRKKKRASQALPRLLHAHSPKSLFFTPRCFMYFSAEYISSSTKKQSNPPGVGPSQPKWLWVAVVGGEDTPLSVAHQCYNVATQSLGTRVSQFGNNNLPTTRRQCCQLGLHLINSTHRKEQCTFCWWENFLAGKSISFPHLTNCCQDLVVQCTQRHVSSWQRCWPFESRVGNSCRLLTFLEVLLLLGRAQTTRPHLRGKFELLAG